MTNWDEFDPFTLLTHANLSITLKFQDADVQEGTILERFAAMRTDADV